MTIERQYSLPNCKLILQGLSDSKSNPNDKRPQMSMLMNAECHFVGHPQPLTGGRDFFESLVKQVNQYAQGFLSGVPSPESVNGQPEIVQMQRLDENKHRLLVNDPKNGAVSQPSQPNPSIQQIDLNTVQLFDLVEAVDQFFADSQTLPELSLQLRPVSKRTLKAEKPVAQKALPAAIGFSSVAVAALALFFVPVPEVRRPSEPVPQTQSEIESLETPPATGSGDPPVGSESPEESLEPNLSGESINDPVEIERLQALLYEEINREWQTEPTFTEPLTYRVSVASDGAIVGYKAVNEITESQEDQIPLADLLYKPAGSRTPDEPLADYQVIFNPDGILDITPWSKTTGEDSGDS
ncbi:DUF4335 domain-containing protein [Capilliphycus salinus ALCB114379]|uniref:DUF4335 domain-containing protein n=1 Tax=Capilliphycus salinus TaxID=2768948 RepID=UPI0039A5EE73